jgi:type I restriction-modification system DNA methylase subunit
VEKIDLTISPIIAELVERFQNNEKDYHASHYNEAQLRHEFLDPLFESLGWDVNNRRGYAEAYKEVIHEDAIKVKGGTKAPDYCFRIGGTRKFFVEAKRPSINIREDASPAFQLRRYAWSAKLPLSILTDFEEFAVYDCRLEPRQSDKASVARILLVKYTDYARDWENIASIFSRDAIPKGSFDRYAESTLSKKGTTEVDVAFLRVIEDWRAELARNFALRNSALTTRELNFAVQRTIDRIVFLRICEDRGIENYGGLRDLQLSSRLYERLGSRFREADDKYNSGLFHFHKENNRPEPPDELTLRLKLDDGPLKNILRQLYYPDSPYEFSVLPADILGQVYEQFLGKVIRLTDGHRAVVEDKPGVKKAGGIFYTPTYIVRFIVENAIGSLCAERTPKELARLRILDPACGSGSFLIAAYQYLLDWHLSWYHEHGPEGLAKGKSPAIHMTSTGEWRLTTGERKRILLNNIFGVDVDTQAVETTKLSLLLKVLEGETSETVGQTMHLFHERALPDLDQNIKCGNALVAPDLYQQLEIEQIAADERYRINVFDWSKEFPDIVQGGGFHAIIGNPPYVDIKTLPTVDAEYIFSKYKTANNRINLFATFIERALSLLAPRHFRFAMIVPTALAAQDSYQALRRLILQSAQLTKVVRLPNESFGESAGDVKVDTMIFVLEEKPRTPKRIEIIGYRGYARVTEIDPGAAQIHTFVDQSDWETNQDSVWAFNTGDSDQSLLQKCEIGTVALEECAEFCLGLTPYDKYKGHTPKQIQDRVFHSASRKDSTYKKLLAGNDVLRYAVKWNGRTWINYGPWLGAARERRFFTSRRILVKQIIDWTSKRIWAALVDEELYNTQNAFNLLPRPEWEVEYLLGIINSRLMTFYHRKRFLDEFKMRFQKILIKDCRRLPIRQIDQRKKKMVDLRDRLVNAVRRMIALRRDFLKRSGTQHEKTSVERLAAATDREIDGIVYELYELNAHEVEIIERAFE